MEPLLVLGRARGPETGGQAFSLGVRGSRVSREVAGSGSALEGPVPRRRRRKRKDPGGEEPGGRPGGRSQKDTGTPHQTRPEC